MAHNFDNKQKIDNQGNLGLATGPVDPDTERMFWIAAFVYQNEPPGHYAAAWGRNEWEGGKDKKWDCPMEMAPGSQTFNKGAAEAWALACVTDQGGMFFAWHDDVTLE
jgi:hypothetical protein